MDRKFIIYVGVALAILLGVSCYSGWIDCDPASAPIERDHG